MTEMYAKHGEVFTIPLLHKKMTFLIGPHVSPHFYNATDDKMSQSEVGCWLAQVGMSSCLHDRPPFAHFWWHHSGPPLTHPPPLPPPPLQVYEFNVPTFGKGVVYDVDQKVRSEQFRWVADALRTAKLRTYVPAFKMVRGGQPMGAMLGAGMHGSAAAAAWLACEGGAHAV